MHEGSDERSAAVGLEDTQQLGSEAGRTNLLLLRNLVVGA